MFILGLGVSALHPVHELQAVQADALDNPGPQDLGDVPDPHVGDLIPYVDLKR